MPPFDAATHHEHAPRGAAGTPRVDAPESPGTAEPLPERLPAVDLTDNARTVLARRYLRCDDRRTPVEEPEHMFWRVARAIAAADGHHGATADERDRTARRFYGLMAEGRFLPNSPTLMNAGREKGQLSACFVLPVADSLSNGKDGIYDTLTAMAKIHQSGGGTGFSFSRLRPEGDRVRSSSGVASGPLSFMTLYDASTGVVKQGGTRRGANMGILRVDHPDIRSFIACKQDTSQVTNFNLSVAVTDAFMAACAEGRSYDLIHPASGEVVETEDAAEIWDLIVRGAWATGEPGVFFVDRANEHNPVPHLGAYEATNPCGEQPLLSYDVCNLGSIDVGAFARHGTPDDAPAKDRIDWPRLGETVEDAVHFLDNVIDVGRFPLPEIEQRARAIRRIGLGVMGWADLLVRVGVSYDSDEAVELARELMAFVDGQARDASEALATRRGVFPEWERSVWGPADRCARDARGRRVRPERRLRHCNLTTVAPTGTISMIAGCSGGIEPLFAVAFERRQADARMVDVNADFVERGKREGWYSEDLIERIAQTGHVHHPTVPAAAQRLFVTSHEIPPERHVQMQAAFQEHTDAAISKTTNFPAEATEDDVRAIFELAFELGTKGVTVYRDGSRPGQVLSTGRTGATAAARGAVPKLDRPEVLAGRTIKQPSPLGDLYVTVNADDGRPFEVFCTVGKAGGAANADSEAIGRLISLALRHGVPLAEVRDQLRGIACDRPIGLGPDKVLSAPDGIAQALERFMELESGDGVTRRSLEPDVLATCPDCDSSQLVFEEGCATCHVCGYSGCG